MYGNFRMRLYYSRDCERTSSCQQDWSFKDAALEVLLPRLWDTHSYLRLHRVRNTKMNGAIDLDPAPQYQDAKPRLHYYGDFDQKLEKQRKKKKTCLPCSPSIDPGGPRASLSLVSFSVFSGSFLMSRAPCPRCLGGRGTRGTWVDYLFSRRAGNFASG